MRCRSQSITSVKASHEYYVSGQPWRLLPFTDVDVFALCFAALNEPALPKAGPTFCAVASMKLMGTLDTMAATRREGLVEWCVNRQVRGMARCSPGCS